MVFEIKDVDLGGRIGKLCTPHGCIETPAFFPVVDVYRQEVSLEDIARIGFRQVITNAYLTLKRFGDRAVEKGIHGILNWEGVVMTDSGAYQILEYGNVDVSPHEIIKFQESIGSDIAVILDIPTGDVNRAKARETVEETLRRAIHARELIRGSSTLWVLPVQGGRYLDLVEYSAREASKIHEEYSIFGLGSPTVYLERYNYIIIVRMLAVARRVLPWGKPLHLFGAGHPLIIPLAVALGADLFDSASYIIYARDDRYITEYGVERLERIEYFPCNCPVCSKYTPEELRSLPKPERTRLLAIHNLYMIKKSIERTKQAIREGRLWEYIEEVSRRHPRALEAFREMASKARDLLEETTPSTKGVVRGLRLYDYYSARRPRVERYKERLKSYLYGRPRPSRIILLPYPDDASQCPLSSWGGADMRAYYLPFLGLIPEELCGVYPTIHVDFPEEHLDSSVLDSSGEEAARLIYEILGGEGEVVVALGREGWRRLMALTIEDRLRSLGLRVVRIE